MARPHSTRRAGCVYIARVADGRYKIGKARNVARRLKTLEYEFKTAFTLVHKIATNDALWLERKFHVFFGESNIVSEWFNLTDKEVAAIKKMKRHDRLRLKARNQFQEDRDTLSGHSLNGEATKDEAASALGSKGGKKGGHARAAKLSPERRREIARMGGLARQRKKEQSPPTGSA